MLGRTNTGGGGGGLNFQFIGGITAPNNPRENTIWVNTDTEITGWIFSSTKPETAVEGMVWMSTGTDGRTEFNALKKNGIMVYPLSAKQHIDGGWVSKEAEIYQKGTWDSIVSTQYIFKEFEGAVIPLSAGSQEPANFSVKITNGNIYAYGFYNTGSAVSVYVCTTNKTDLHGYSTLYFDLSISATWPNDTIGFGVSSIPITAQDPETFPFIAKKTLGVCSRQIISVDITDVSEGYIGACGCGNFYIYNWWYE